MAQHGPRNYLMNFGDAPLFTGSDDDEVFDE